MKPHRSRQRIALEAAIQPRGALLFLQVISPLSLDPVCPHAIHPSITQHRRQAGDCSQTVIDG